MSELAASPSPIRSITAAMEESVKKAAGGKGKKHAIPANKG
jgi:hypothetical protein